MRKGFARADGIPNLTASNLNWVCRSLNESASFNERQAEPARLAARLAIQAQPGATR
jgi:hypothetical protein